MGLWYDLKIGFNPRYKDWYKGWVEDVYGWVFCGMYNILI